MTATTFTSTPATPTAICPDCHWPARVATGSAIAPHTRWAADGTSVACSGSGSAWPTTEPGAALILRLHEEHRQAVDALDGDAHNDTRVAARAVRDLCARLLREAPELVLRAEMAAVENDHDEERRMAGLLEGVA